MAASFELSGELAKVVELAVVDEDRRTILSRHRLVPGRRDVDDREPQVDEADAVADPYPFVVRTAVPKDPEHALQLTDVDGRLAEIEDARDPAHQVPTSSETARANIDAP